MIKMLSLKKICLTNALGIVVAGTSFGQSPIQINGMDVSSGVDEVSDSAAPYIIFSNLGSKDDRYNAIGFDAKPIVGRQVDGLTEEWEAIRFVPSVEVQATVLEAAVGWSAGIRIVRLGIYDSGGLFGFPGSPLPGGQGTTTDVPDLGDCCQLAKVALPQPVTLNAGEIYWLVCSPDPSGPDFNGAWQVSHSGESAYLTPPNPWNPQPGEWPAGRVRGTRIRNEITFEGINETAFAHADAVSGKVTVFSNLSRAFAQPYLPGIGLPIYGNSVPLFQEAWEAIPFTPKTNVHLKTLSAAIGQTGGTSKINLGIFTDAGGIPGALLPSGQGSTTNIPGAGDCCDFATVNLPRSGAELSAGAHYWLVASPSSDAEDFSALWQISTESIWAQLKPEQSGIWTGYNGEWAGAQLTGRSN